MTTHARRAILTFVSRSRPLLTCRRYLCRQSNGNKYILFVRARCLGSAFFCLNNSFKVVKPIATQELLINEEIRDKEVRLIDEKGEQLGIVKIEHALRIADEKELDLVKIVPNANPPVCKIMDYGKARFEQIKREKEQRRNQTVVETKEIRLSSTIDTHDMEVKAKACVKFLKSGNKVKASIRFRGRQISHGSVGLDVMNAFYEMVRDYAVIERPAKQEGRNMAMILAPKPAAKN